MAAPRHSAKALGAPTWLVLAAVLLAPAARGEDGMSSGDLVPEVISRSQSPHAFDWRAATAELEVAGGEVNEANNFNTATVELGCGLPTNGGSLVRFGARRTSVYSTSSSDDVGRTPFLQAAQQTRYELYGDFAFGLLEGRAMTRFSPAVPDVENALFLELGGHYSHPNASLVPHRTDNPDPLPGQNPVNATFVFEVGLRLHVYLPQSFGLAFESLYNRPLGNTGALHSWNYLSGGLLWSFGAR